MSFKTGVTTVVELTGTPSTPSLLSPSEKPSASSSTNSSTNASANCSIADSPVEVSQHALPPVDRGHRAWLCLVGCFIGNALIWGFAFSFGVLQQYYSSHEPFASQQGIATIGTTLTGLMYLPMPLYMLAYQWYPRCRAWSIWASLPLVAVGLIGASFANTVGQLIFCQSVLFAIGGNALFVASFSYLDEWFVERKGLAVGIMWAGDGAGGAIMPFLLQALLEKVGFRWTFRALAGLMILLVAPLILFLKPRLPLSPTRVSMKINLGFLRSHVFWIWWISNIIQGFGYFLPPNYLPTIAASMGLGSTISSLTLTIINVSTIFGCIAVGALVDRFDTSLIVMATSVLASVAIFTLWALSTSMAPLLLFCVLYGLTAGGYSTAWGGMAKSIQQQHPEADTTLLFGILAAGRGIGSIVSGPLSEALLARGAIATTSVGTTATVLMGTYGPLVIFAGCAIFCGGCSWCFKVVGLLG